MFTCGATCSVKGSTSHLLCGHDEHLITSQSLFQHRCSRVVSRVASKAAHLTCFVVTMNTSSRPKAFFNTDVHEWCHVQRQRQHLSPALWSRCTPHHVPKPFSTQMITCSVTCSVKGSTSHLLCGHDVHLITSQGFPHRIGNAFINAVGSQPARQIRSDPLIAHATKEVNQLYFETQG